MHQCCWLQSAVCRQAVAALPSEYLPKQVSCWRPLAATAVSHITHGRLQFSSLESKSPPPLPQGLSFVYCTAQMFKESLTVEQLKGICCTLQCPEQFFVADSLSRAWDKAEGNHRNTWLLHWLIGSWKTSNNLKFPEKPITFSVIQNNEAAARNVPPCGCLRERQWSEYCIPC